MDARADRLQRTSRKVANLPDSGDSVRAAVCQAAAATARAHRVPRPVGPHPTWRQAVGPLDLGFSTWVHVKETNL